MVMCVCVCVRVCVCVCVCVCVFKYIVVFENNSDKFHIGTCQTKVKDMVRLLNVSPFTAIQTVRSYNSTLVQARKLILSVYVYLIIIYNFINIVTLE